VAADEALRALADEVPDDRTAPNVLLAAVHALLLSGAESPLADFYASVVDDPVDPAARDPVPAFRTFCATHESELVPMLRERRTQTNAVRRCGALYPAFARVDALTEGPLSLVEVGPSAGLNLRWDRYRYDYGPAGTVGRTDSSVEIATEVRAGDPPLPAETPAVAGRTGVDLNPLDVTDPDDVLWLRALTWPHQRTRRAVLEAAIQQARSDPPTVVQGDAIERLPSMVAALPDPVVVFDTLVMYQLDGAQRERFREVVTRLGDGRELHWLSGWASVDGDAPELWLDHSTVEDGELVTERLLAFEQHGRWIRWRK
jgi:hypothetical protein